MENKHMEFHFILTISFILFIENFMQWHDYMCDVYAVEWIWMWMLMLMSVC